MSDLWNLFDMNFDEHIYLSENVAVAVQMFSMTNLRSASTRSLLDLGLRLSFRKASKASTFSTSTDMPAAPMLQPLSNTGSGHGVVAPPAPVTRSSTKMIYYCDCYKHCKSLKEVNRSKYYRHKKFREGTVPQPQHSPPTSRFAVQSESPASGSTQRSGAQQSATASSATRAPRLDPRMPVTSSSELTNPQGANEDNFEMMDVENGIDPRSDESEVQSFSMIFFVLILNSFFKISSNNDERNGNDQEPADEHEHEGALDSDLTLEIQTNKPRRSPCCSS